MIRDAFILKIGVRVTALPRVKLDASNPQLIRESGFSTAVRTALKVEDRTMRWRGTRTSHAFRDGCARLQAGPPFTAFRFHWSASLIGLFALIRFGRFSALGYIFIPSATGSMTGDDES